MYLENMCAVPQRERFDRGSIERFENQKQKSDRSLRSEAGRAQRFHELCQDPGARSRARGARGELEDPHTIGGAATRNTGLYVHLFICWAVHSVAIYVRYIYIYTYYICIYLRYTLHTYTILNHYINHKQEVRIRPLERKVLARSRNLSGTGFVRYFPNRTRENRIVPECPSQSNSRLPTL